MNILLVFLLVGSAVCTRILITTASGQHISLCDLRLCVVPRSRLIPLELEHRGNQFALRQADLCATRNAQHILFRACSEISATDAALFQTLVTVGDFQELLEVSQPTHKLLSVDDGGREVVLQDLNGHRNSTHPRSLFQIH